MLFDDDHFMLYDGEHCILFDDDQYILYDELWPIHTIWWCEYYIIYDNGHYLL